MKDVEHFNVHLNEEKWMKKKRNTFLKVWKVWRIKVPLPSTLGDWAEANLLSSVIVSHLCSTSSLSVFQERGCVCLWGLPALHGVGSVPARQFVAGHLCHAGQGDGHHCVRSVCALRRPGALPQAPHLVSTQGFCFVYVLFVFFLSWFMWHNGPLSVHTLFQQCLTLYLHS